MYYFVIYGVVAWNITVGASYYLLTAYTNGSQNCQDKCDILDFWQNNEQHSAAVHVEQSLLCYVEYNALSPSWQL